MATPSLPTIPIFHTPIPGIAYARAHHLAKRAVETELRAQGLQPAFMPYTKVLAMMDEYKAAHVAELLVQAIADVQASPTLRAWAEKEERQREREERKRARNGVLAKPTSPPVT
jgi:hypothetical protein